MADNKRLVAQSLTKRTEPMQIGVICNFTPFAYHVACARHDSQHNFLAIYIISPHIPASIDLELYGIRAPARAHTRKHTT